MSDDLMNEIAAAKDKSSIIMVVGVGGAGGNAVNHMWNLGIKDVGFMVCNTDAQALDNSPVEEKVQLGREGLGAGNDPENGRKAAIESLDDIRRRLEAAGTRMLFVTAGMGGGTGTGASPVIAKLAHEMGILTVGIVTSPLAVEGKIRYEQAFRGIEELSRNVDSLSSRCTAASRSNRPSARPTTSSHRLPRASPRSSPSKATWSTSTSPTCRR